MRLPCQLVCVVVCLLATEVQAQWTVNQGKPGPYGSWPVSVTSAVNADGGTMLVFDAKGAGLNGTTIAAGMVPGTDAVLKFGRNPDVDTATVPEDLWGYGGAYTGFPSSADGGAHAETLQVFSDNAADTALGTGARTVTLEGLDVNYQPITETVALNGVTPVLTAQAFGRVNLMYVASVGSGGSNAGIITSRHSTTTANVFTYMPVGYNQCQCAAYTMPQGRTAYLREFGLQMLGGNTAQLTAGLWVRWPGTGVGRLLRPYDMLDSTNIDDQLLGGLALPARTDIIPRIIYSATNNVSVSGHMDFYLLTP